MQQDYFTLGEGTPVAVSEQNKYHLTQMGWNLCSIVAAVMLSPLRNRHVTP